MMLRELMANLMSAEEECIPPLERIGTKRLMGCGASNMKEERIKAWTL
jgi:hypothetical protein